MKEQQAKVTARVLKKLTALRKTLKKDERAVLDLLIIGPFTEQEVEGHKLQVPVGAIYTPTSTAKREPGKPEVQAHRLQAPGAIYTPTSTAKREPAQPEVEAHQMHVPAGAVYTPPAKREPEQPEVEGHALTTGTQTAMLDDLRGMVTLDSGKFVLRTDSGIP